MQFCNALKILLFSVLVDRIASRPEDWPLLKREFSLVTPENCMKPAAIQSEPGVCRWEAPDAFVNFARSNNLKVVGHGLVWAKDDRTPAWFCAEGNQPKCVPPGCATK